MTVKSFSQYFQSLQIVCGSFITGAVVFCSIVVFITRQAGIAGATQSQVTILNILVPLFAVTGVAAGSIIFKKRLEKTKILPSLDEKLSAYKVSIIIRCILLDGPALFAGISYFVSGNRNLLFVTAALILIMLYFFPNKSRLMRELEFTQQQVDFINANKN